MYAVIKTGGKQYRVSPGDMLVVEKLAGEPGANVSFGDVLMLGEGDAVTIGVPTVKGASVTATLVETRKGEKIKIFKKIRRQGYRRTGGHRQHETVLQVTSIAGDGKSAKWDGVVNMATNKAVVHTTESTEQMGNIGEQVTLQKSLSAANLEPGIYKIEIKVNDNISKQTVDPTVTFAVE